MPRRTARGDKWMHIFACDSERRFVGLRSHPRDEAIAVLGFNRTTSKRPHGHLVVGAQCFWLLAEGLFARPAPVYYMAPHLYYIGKGRKRIG